MKKYLIRRVGEMFITLFLIVTATFFILAAIPGNALTSKIAKLPETVQVKMMEKYGYDKPVLERYVMTMKNMVLEGDFGESIIRPGDTFSKNLETKLPVTIRLSVQQILLGVTVGISFELYHKTHLALIDFYKKDAIRLHNMFYETPSLYSMP